MLSEKRSYLLLLFSIFVFGLLINWVIKIVKGAVPYTDQWTKEFVEAMADSHVYTIARWITELGSASFLVPFTIIIGLLLWWTFRDFLPALLFSGGALASHLANVIIKELVARERPRIFIEANAEGYSFPSGHAMLSMVCYGLLAYFMTQIITSKKAKLGIKVIFGVLIFLIGVSRVIINVHYLTDVIIGFVLGFLCLIGLIYTYKGARKAMLTKSHL